MRLLILVAVLVLCDQAWARSISLGEKDARQLYEQFKRKYDRKTSNDEDQMRFGIFKRNLMRSELHQKEDRGTAKYGVTKFSDLTEQEFASTFLNMRMTETRPTLDWTVANNLPNAPDSFDWRLHGAVNDVEDQGQCGSCWAFSVVASVEGHWAIKKSQLLRLSKQQMLDCDKTADGCRGGFPSRTMKTIIEQGGLMLEDQYSYEGKESYCDIRENMFAAYINESIDLPPNEEIQKTYMATEGPMSVCLNAEYLQFYESGVIHPPTWKCSKYNMNHAVLTVGYGQVMNHPFWIVKNSWGYDWGEQGYFRIQFGEGVCGINTMVVMPITH